MKRPRFIIVLIATSLFISCSNDSNDLINEKAGNKTESSVVNVDRSVENFRMAITEINKPEYLPTKEYTRKHGNELSPERKAILFTPAINLIYSTENPETNLAAKTMADTNRILNKAFKIYISKTGKN